jgi:hypothetical protein
MEEKVKYYAGIGARTSPPKILTFMTEIASVLEAQGWTLRSGAADGADSAFAAGVKKSAEIWIPWSSFGKPHNPNHTYKVIDKSDKEAFDSVLQFHPKGATLRDSVRALHSRNFRQVVGLNASNSKFVICWTPKGEKVGGTATAISCAEYYNIPVFNLGKEKDCARIKKWLAEQTKIRGKTCESLIIDDLGTFEQ